MTTNNTINQYVGKFENKPTDEMSDEDQQAVDFSNQLINDWPVVYGVDRGLALHQFVTQLMERELTVKEIHDAADYFNHSTLRPVLPKVQRRALVLAALKGNTPVPTPDDDYEIFPAQRDARTPIEDTTPTPDSQAHTFTVRSFKEATCDTTHRWLVKRLIPLGGFAMLIGKPSEGKTFTAQDIALAVARGIPWQNCKTKQGAVLYVSAEGSLEARTVAYRKHHELQDADIPFYAIEETVNLFGSHKHASAIIAASRDIAAKTSQPIRLIVLDTLNAMMPGGDENSGQDMGRFIASARSIQQQTGAAILILHHLGKDASRGARGHSSLEGTFDAMLEIVKGILTVKKQRNEKKGQQFGFRLETVLLGKDEDGDSISSCVIVPAPHFKVTPLKPDSVPAKLLTIIENLSFADGRASVDQCQEEFRKLHYPGRTKSENWDTFKRAKTKLLEAMRIVEDGDCLAPTEDSNGEE